MGHGAGVVPDHVLWYNGLVGVFPWPLANSADRLHEGDTCPARDRSAKNDGATRGIEQGIEALQRQAPIGVPSIEHDLIYFIREQFALVYTHVGLCNVIDEETQTNEATRMAYSEIVQSRHRPLLTVEPPVDAEDVR